MRGREATARESLTTPDLACLASFLCVGSSFRSCLSGVLADELVFPSSKEEKEEKEGRQGFMEYERRTGARGRDKMERERKRGG